MSRRWAKPTPSHPIICARPARCPTTLATNERLLGIIVKMFQRGEYNKIRLANKAIAQFEAETLIIT